MADALSNVLVIGHWFSRHLRDWSFRNNCMNLNLDRSRVTVFWQGTRGRPCCVSVLPTRCYGNILIWSASWRWTSSSLMLAGNDLSYRVHDWLTHTKPADRILKLSKECLNFGAKQVLISEFLTKRILQLFNSRAEDTNEEIKLLVQGDLTLYFWQHNHNLAFCLIMYITMGSMMTRCPSLSCPLDSLPPGGQAVPGYLAPHPGYLHPRGASCPGRFILPPAQHK